ncbi:unnamed protein product [Closterium sp. Naga37s-1]|nr:unnamed protein product [Closterium sp. Naga37s-1]
MPSPTEPISEGSSSICPLLDEAHTGMTIAERPLRSLSSRQCVKSSSPTASLVGPVWVRIGGGGRGRREREVGEGGGRGRLQKEREVREEGGRGRQKGGGQERQERDV